jgi:hypothetical protein
MCGSKSQLHTHHMRYTRLGTRKEWQEIAVLCETCHKAYHKRVKTVPEWTAPRMELLTQLAATLMREGIDIVTFHRHGDELNDYWLRNPVIEEGLWEHASVGKVKKKDRPKTYGVMPKADSWKKFRWHRLR